MIRTGRTPWEGRPPRHLSSAVKRAEEVSSEQKSLPTLGSGSPPMRSPDSQEDSQSSGHVQTTAKDHGIRRGTVELQPTCVDDSGRLTRGLQNRGRSSAEV